MNRLGTLAQQLITNVCVFLPVLDIIHVAKTCKHMNERHAAEELWTILYFRDLCSAITEHSPCYMETKLPERGALMDKPRRVQDDVFETRHCPCRRRFYGDGGDPLPVHETKDMYKDCERKAKAQEPGYMTSSSERKLLRGCWPTKADYFIRRFHLMGINWPSRWSTDKAILEREIIHNEYDRVNLGQSFLQGAADYHKNIMDDKKLVQFLALDTASPKLDLSVANISSVMSRHRSKDDYDGYEVYRHYEPPRLSPIFVRRHCCLSIDVDGIVCGHRYSPLNTPYLPPCFGTVHQTASATRAKLRSCKGDFETLQHHENTCPNERTHLKLLQCFDSLLILTVSLRDYPLERVRTRYYLANRHKDTLSFIHAKISCEFDCYFRRCELAFHGRRAVLVDTLSDQRLLGPFMVADGDDDDRSELPTPCQVSNDLFGCMEASFIPWQPKDLRLRKFKSNKWKRDPIRIFRGTCVLSETSVLPLELPPPLPSLSSSLASSLPLSSPLSSSSSPPLPSSKRHKPND